ncbi:hypothetical protein mRhiFer1_008915 [Rhinolophus ferrumequinum]|uniref:Uncharacterized protein n=1 Tax=Rhinolophus ferrumequinum TaxID=59479 RepID=A0A7J7TER9_RHIFE|nr:hypothetical protein mRhiFer1_008915 [Rhinolophus ferrumequinum]
MQWSRWPVASRPWVQELDIENRDLKRYIFSICLAAAKKIAAKLASSNFLLSAKRSFSVKEHYPIPGMLRWDVSVLWPSCSRTLGMGPFRGTTDPVMYPGATKRGRARVGNVHCWERSESCFLQLN